MYAWRIVLWGAGIACLAVSVLLLRSAIAPWLPPLCFVLAFVFPLAGEVYGNVRGLREKRERYIRTFGPVDALRQSIDSRGLRWMRDEKGVMKAVRELRRRHPGMPLDLAVMLVKEL
ncbi:hypothetical protein ACFWNC_03520 [Streptomyces sp. NPDC058369]|uniref:hypothetical protein n=1 Tax=Streptomyces sp. NPDC058369 TaxID=3346462 RepID=UPI00365F7EF4